MEDVGIVMGKVLHQALGEKAGIKRFGWASVPLDETLAQVTVDLSEVRHVEPLGLELLRQAVDQDEAVGTRSPLHLVVAEPSRPRAAPPQGAWETPPSATGSRPQ